MYFKANVFQTSVFLVKLDWKLYSIDMLVHLYDIINLYVVKHQSERAYFQVQFISKVSQEKYVDTNF